MALASLANPSRSETAPTLFFCNAYHKSALVPQFVIHGTMGTMPRFSLKDILRGITLASIGVGMLAVVFNEQSLPTSKQFLLLQALLVGFGGMLVGYGLAFPFKYPPHQMMFAMTGMFAAQGWQSGSSVGLVVYVSLTALLGSARAIQNFRTKRDTR
jgi:hypothetical protein